MTYPFFPTSRSVFSIEIALKTHFISFLHRLGIANSVKFVLNLVHAWWTHAVCSSIWSYFDERYEIHLMKTNESSFKQRTVDLISRKTKKPNFKLSVWYRFIKIWKTKYSVQFMCDCVKSNGNVFVERISCANYNNSWWYKSYILFMILPTVHADAIVCDSLEYAVRFRFTRIPSHQINIKPLLKFIY